MLYEVVSLQSWFDNHIVNESNETRALLYEMFLVKRTERPESD